MDYELPDTSPENSIKFYGITGPHGFLSNFYPCDLLIDGIRYHSVEQYYQSMKFTKMPFVRRRILSCVTPKDVFALAKAFSQKIDHDWVTRKEQVMIKGLDAKFSNKDLAKRLLETGNRELIENNPKDSFWGCGYDGYGLNRTGTLLMRKREQLQSLSLNLRTSLKSNSVS